MKFGISRVFSHVLEVKEFKTLEELIEWVKTQQEEVIIKTTPPIWKDPELSDYEYELEIYDGYRE